MVFLDVGVGDGATVGIGVDQRHLPPAATLKARLKEAFLAANWSVTSCAPAEAGGTDGVEGLVKTAARR